MKEIERILVPVDGGDASKRALEEAYQLAWRYDADVEVFHTWQVPTPMTAAHAPLATAALQPNINDVEEQARLRIHALLDSVEAPPGVRVTPRLEHGSPADRIVDRAAGVDLIVMGATRKGTIERLLLGSTTQKVVAEAPCPVLTVHSRS